MKRQYTVIDEAGLHARPVSLLVAKASSHPNEITMWYKDKPYTMKSILMIMSLSVQQHDQFSIEVQGDNAEEILDSLEAILKENKLAS
ncbi:HPr family phosphocarrier protein [Candidatus Xianfuyuplasma coldseepsis]|uniref:HPr family phosphocarrier protein n=1 Tax=Candidatus Xianfuyuplasma coldseepsis TaxID=2782163 RepID=A0A7L7KSD8_9MOLU|nr:HPr family phosphocarrier protein [Xianfuyuplasma coldseepsis]QMS85126.1 HPr family phosphocarrier protein [Xianfuyuplasma coldseepsis]